MRDYKVVTIVVKDGNVVNMLMVETETEGIKHAEYCLSCYGDESGTTQIASFKQHNDGMVEMIADLSDMIRAKK